MSESAPIRKAPAWFQWSVFPLTLSATLALALGLPSFGIPVAAAIGPAQAFGTLVVLLLERVYPLHRSWLHSRGDVPVDLIHLVVTAVTVLVLGPFTLVLAVHAAGWLSASLGSPLWPQHWSLLVQLPLALMLSEFLQYWWHRAQHEVDFFWRFHATHHSAPRLYWLNASRFHPFDILVNHMASFTLLVLLGCGEELIALCTLVSGVHGNFQHANLQLRCGPLNWFFSMAELHRWHHSKRVSEANHNFGQNLIVWDVVFGTRFLPADREPPEDIGIGDPTLRAFPMDYLGQLASPFRWRRIREQAAEAES